MTTNERTRLLAEKARIEAEVRQSATAPLIAALEEAREALESRIEQVMNVSTPLMGGDNLAVLLCSHFDNPDQESDDDCGWSPDAIAAYDQIKAAVEAHFAPALTRITETLAKHKGAEDGQG